MLCVIGFSRVDCFGSLNLESTHPCYVEGPVDPHSPQPRMPLRIGKYNEKATIFRRNKTERITLP